MRVCMISTWDDLGVALLAAKPGVIAEAVSKHVEDLLRHARELRGQPEHAKRAYPDLGERLLHRRFVRSFGLLRLIDRPRGWIAEALFPRLPFDRFLRVRITAERP